MKPLALAAIALLFASGTAWYVGRGPAGEAEASELAPAAPSAAARPRGDTTLARHESADREQRVELDEAPTAEPSAESDDAPLEKPEAAAEPQELPAAHGIRVTVLDPAGAPVVGADVELQLVGERMIYERHKPRIEPTDDAGRTTIEEVPPKPVRVSATKPGFAAAASDVLRPGEDGHRRSLEIRLGVGGAVEGILPGLDGEPAAGVALSIHLRAWPGQLGNDYPGVSKRATTTMNGSFRFEHLTPGVHSLRTLDGGTGLERVGERSLEVLVVEGETTRAVFEDLSASFVRLEGQVLCNGEPVAEARISVGWADRSRGYLGKSAKADAEGRFELVLDEGGDYRFQISRSGTRGSVFQQHSLPQAERHFLELAYETAGLSGTVFGPDGQPVPDFPVMALGRQGEGAGGTSVRSTRTDASGAYELPDLLVADYRVLAGVQQLHPDQPVENPRPFLGSANATDVRLGPGEHREGVDLRLPAAGVIDARVVDGDGRPVPSAQLNCYSPGSVGLGSTSRAQTDESGALQLGGLAPGVHHVKAQLEAEISAWSTVEVSAERVTTLELRIAPGTLLDVELRGGSDEKPPPYLSAVDSLERLGGFARIHEGRAEIGPLSPGRYAIRVPGPEGEEPAILAHVEVDGEPRRSIVIDLP